MTNTSKIHTYQTAQTNQKDMSWYLSYQLNKLRGYDINK